MNNEDRFDLDFRELIKNDGPDVPEIVRTRVDETLASLPKHRPVRKKASYISIAAALLIGCVFGLGFVSPVVAQVLKQIPLIGFVFETAGDPGLQEANKEGFTIPVNQTGYDSGIKLTITEVLFDGARLSIGYLQESYFGSFQPERPNIFVNGKEINFSVGYTGKILGPTKVAGVMSIDPTEELPEKFNLEMRIDAVGIIPGNWEFKFPVSMGKSKLVAAPGITKSYADIELTVKKVTLAPSATNLKLQVKWPQNKYYLDFRLSDDRGMILQNFSMAGGGDSSNGIETMQYSASFAPVKEKPKFLILRTVLDEWNGNQNKPPASDIVTEVKELEVKIPLEW